MRWWIGLTAGLLGSVLMYLVTRTLVATDLAPFNVHPASAFLLRLKVVSPWGAMALHLLYGTAMALVLVGVAGARTDLARGVALAAILWLAFMLLWAPFIGWGFFGLSAANRVLPPEHPLHLGSALRFLIGTATTHLIYGATTGALIRYWMHKERTRTPGGRPVEARA